jgi:hypothetical protein
MIWWLKVRRAQTLLVASIGAFAALLLLADGRLAIFPSFLGGVQHAALTLFVPIPLLAATMFSLESRVYSLEKAGVRTLRLLDISLVTAVVIFAVTISLFLGFALGSPAITAAGRNTTFLLGLMLCARWAVGRAAVVAPVAWLMIVMFFGFRTGNDPYPWSVLPEPPDAIHATAGALLSYVGGIIFLFIDSRRIDA